MSRYLTEKCDVVESVDFRGFARVLEGVLEKRVFACGAFVVSLWWIAWQTRTRNYVCFDAKKWDSDFDFIFGWKRWWRHPRGSGCDSYRGLDGLWKGLPMQTFYVVLAFLMMIVLPVVISQRGDADRDAVASSLARIGGKRRSD
jgi:hypothetical protein